MWPLGSGFRVLALQVSELSLQPGSHLTLLGSITSSAFNSSPHKFSIYLFILFIQCCFVKFPHTNESSKVLKGVPEQGGSKKRRKTTFVSTLWCWQPFIWHCEKWKIKLFISFFFVLLMISHISSDVLPTAHCGMDHSLFLVVIIQDVIPVLNASPYHS